MAINLLILQWYRKAFLLCFLLAIAHDICVDNVCVVQPCHVKYSKDFYLAIIIIRGRLCPAAGRTSYQIA
jgi:hypothetical protein